MEREMTYWEKMSSAECPICKKKPNYVGGRDLHDFKVHYILENGICFDCDTEENAEIVARHIK
jgi:hypothetical protein